MRLIIPGIAFLSGSLMSGCVPRLQSHGPDIVVDWVAPENTWPVTETPPPSGTQCGGFDVGDRPCDLRLTDQFGDEVSLWQFWGDVIVLDVSTVWCSPCQKLAATTQETYEHFEPQGFMYLTLLQQDAHGDATKPEDLQLWVDAYDIEAPVLNDAGMAAQDALTSAGTYPAVLIIDRNMKVHYRMPPPFEGELVDAAVEALINE